MVKMLMLVYIGPYVDLVAFVNFEESWETFIHRLQFCDNLVMKAVLLIRMMILFMPSLHDAAEAVKCAQGIRDDLDVRILQPDENIGP